ncbi:hypothetical protein FOA43_000566 [Brettanomyces nanus]|uniref:Homeobox domain-containing protein n=1 Tax=Eeniella nana TaxID=13502 RepID=A0A875RXB9_EENNA|nr:uncharacterized protein FOA43_000566 [Brettanomyces nanus]QPG73258.1 hypothetical protein FOA43_000566 [Brettanomyces nanus]
MSTQQISNDEQNKDFQFVISDAELSRRNGEYLQDGEGHSKSERGRSNGATASNNDGSHDLMGSARSTGSSGSNSSNESNAPNKNNTNNGQEKPTRRSRASGDILELLVAEFNKTSNTNSTIRKAIAIRTGMSERSVRIWFQNRRAKERKIEKMKKEKEQQQQQSHPPQNMGMFSVQQDIPRSGETMPIEINEKYSMIDCRSLSVGQWQRMRSGSIDKSNLNELHNLSPRLLNLLLGSTDLLVILSKKDHELNYFFSGVFQNDKVLFRIFFPAVNVVRTSFIDNQTQKAIGELQVTSSHAQLQMELSASPKFAVHFLRDPNTGQENANQWSICEDFSEGQQVASAHIGEGGTGIPHILTGSLSHLQYLNTAILSYCQLFSQSSFPGPSAEPQLFQTVPLAQNAMTTASLSSVPLPTMLGQPTPTTSMNLDLSRHITYPLDPYQPSTNSPLPTDTSLVAGFQNTGTVTTPGQLTSLGLSMGINNSIDDQSAAAAVVTTNASGNTDTTTPSATNPSALTGKGNNLTDKTMMQLGALDSPDMDIFQDDGTQAVVDDVRMTPEGLMLTNEGQMLDTTSDNIDNPHNQLQGSLKNDFEDLDLQKDSEFANSDFFADDNVNGLDF